LEVLADLFVMGEAMTRTDYQVGSFGDGYAAWFARLPDGHAPYPLSVGLSYLKILNILSSSAVQ
jgi:hypothetical protein